MPIPVPEPGLVISYAYLWFDEARSGRIEATKDRPCAVVLSSRTTTEGGLFVTVAPITHRAPANPNHAIELPASVKERLGLDHNPSWLVLTEVNRFEWPGFDLRSIPGRPGEYAYGLLPPRLTRAAITRMVSLARSGSIPITRR